MSCPPTDITASSSSMQSVQLRDPVQTQYIFTQRKYPFADFWTQVTRKLSFIPEYEHKTQENAQKTQMDIVPLFFSQKTIEQCQTSLNSSKTLGKWLRSSNDWRKCKKWLVFYLRRWRTPEKLLLQALKTHLQITSEWSFPWKLEGT